MAEQFSYIAGLLLTGVLMGTVFDIYNTVTGASKWLRWIQPVCDIVFWAASGALTFYVAYLTDGGRVRVYLFALVIVGYLAYRVTLHHAVVDSAFTMVRAVRTLFRWITQLLRILVLQPILLVIALIQRIAFGLYVLLCRLENLIFWILHFWLRFTLLPIVARLPFIQSGLRKLSAQWEEIWLQASNWVKSRLARAD